MDKAFNTVITASDAERRDLFLGTAARLGVDPFAVRLDFYGTGNPGHRFAQAAARRGAAAQMACLIMAQVLLAASEFGLPEAIRTDNEAMFTSRVWLAMLKAMSIRARRGPPMQPWHNGRIERLWGTLKQALKGTLFTTAQALHQFARFYNSIRPNQALAGLTPEEAWQGKTMADVQLAHVQGRCDQAVRELLEGFHVRC